MKLLAIISTIAWYFSGYARPEVSFTAYSDTFLVVKKCNDFTVTGKGDNSQWQNAKWLVLNQIDKSAKQLETKIKILYSSTGMYVLFSGEDERITSTYNKDFEKLYNGDVFEVFFHTVPTEPVYFEYEISPLSKELVLLISNRGGKFGQGVPWNYEENKVVKKVSITGGAAKHNNAIQGWSAELFFPYAVLHFFGNVPPKSGMRWNANFCRLDYDSGKMVKWSWSPIKTTFHEIDKFLSVQFE